MVQPQHLKRELARLAPTFVFVFLVAVATVNWTPDLGPLVKV